MVGVEGDCAVLDSGAGVCAVCVDDVEAEVGEGPGLRAQGPESGLMELANKRVLVVGLGKSGLAAARFLKERGARVTVSDARPATLISELPSLVNQGIVVEAGSHGLLTFRRQDLIVGSPGGPMSTPELKQFGAVGMPIIGELELGWRFLQGETVAITGSNGKTTTTALMGEIFKADGRPTLVGGNIGRPVTEMVAESIELSQRGEQQAGPSTALRSA